MGETEAAGRGDKAKSVNFAANVIRFPSDIAINCRLLVQLLDDLTSHIEGLHVLVEQIGFSGNTIIIDDRACVFTGNSAKDLHFSLDMKGGRRVLLITDKVTLMAHFVACYMIRRHEGDPELASYL